MTPSGNFKDSEVDDAIAALNPNFRGKNNFDDSLNMRETSSSPHWMSGDRPNSATHQREGSGSFIQPIAIDNYMGGDKFEGEREAAAFLEDEEKEAEEQRKKDEEKKKQQDSPTKEFFRDTQGNYFDPTKKFGIIQDNSLIYQNVTSSYPLNLPTDYYLKYIQQSLPAKDASTKWFIRPHHLETLTEHPQSVKDDVLNTRYYSHYNQQYGKKIERNEAEEAIKTIEGHLDRLKQQRDQLLMQRGIDPDVIEMKIEE